MASDNHPEEQVPFVEYVVGAIDDRAEAEEAVRTLRADGFAPDDVVLSAPASPGPQARQQEQGTLADAPNTAQRVFTEEGLDQEQFATERQRGRAIIHVHTPHEEDVHRAHAILVAHHAHTLKRVGRWTRENLPEA